MEELKRGSSFTQIPWQTHRPNAILQELYGGDYKLDESDNTYIKYYEINDKKAKGVSCFVPLETPHNVPSERLNGSEIPRYFLPEGLYLPEGFPSGDQGGLHFVIAPTKRMKKEQYEQTVKELDWQLCTIKASAEMNELISRDDDLEDLLQHEPRAYIVFSILARMNSNIPTTHVTELIYLGDILGELEDAFKWKKSEFCA
ncbi:5590_t:CDS:2, partial [Racocetra fulgida]